MGAWFVLSALGLFSAVPGTPNYVLGAPLFREVVISGRLNGGALRIVAEGTGPAVTAVDAVLLFTHGSSVPTILSDSSVSDGPLQRGGTLRFVMKGEGWQRGATLAAQATHLTSPGGAGAGAGTRPSLAPPVAHAPVVAATHTGWFHQAVTATQEDKQQEKNKLQEKIALSDALDKAAAEADASSDGVVVVALERCLLPRCWWDTADQDDHQQQEVQDQHQQEAQLQRWPSVSEAVQAQMCRSYESWRWSDTLEELIDHLQTAALPLPQSQPPPGASPTAAAAAVAGGSGGGGEEGAMEAAQAAQQRRLAQLRLLRGDIDALAEAAAEAAAEPEPEPEPEDASDNVVELDMAAVEAAGVELLPEMSDDWMAAFRN